MQLRLRQQNEHVGEAVKMRRVQPFEDSNEWMDIPARLAVRMRMLLRVQPNPTNMDQYFQKAEFVKGANCHKTSLYLTNKIPFRALFAHSNDTAETGGQVYVHAHSRIARREVSPENIIDKYVKGHTLPVRVSFFKKSGLHDYLPVHSITIVGHTNKGRWVAFEKEDAYADTPFHYSDALARMQEYHDVGGYIGIEPEE